MELSLRHLQACFEGVVPSVIATAAADGTPNISYLSHVVCVDDEHVALSNQFFSKTAANIRANAQAAILIVDAMTGAQYRLDVTFEQTLIEGQLFEKMAAHLRAASTQTGMANVMRLRGVDIYRVNDLRMVPSSAERPAAEPRRNAQMAQVAEIAMAVAAETDFDSAIDTTFQRLSEVFGFAHVLILIHDKPSGRLVTLGSRGYGQTGVGSEVPLGEGVIGICASERRPVCVADMSRMRRLDEAIRISLAPENQTRIIALPGLGKAMSQIAVPMMVQKDFRGVVFVESLERMAFGADAEAALAIVASQLGATLAMIEMVSMETGIEAGPSPQVQAVDSAADMFRVTHYPFDDSIFINNEYVIKGVAGRLLLHLLTIFRDEGRRDFTNRELRLDERLRLPDLKDNLETRLLLLRRRLAEKALPVQIQRSGRGQIRLDPVGSPILTTALGS
ncbi:pyridoxamine 5'-phosphate oxidase family protein [Devosia sp.]|uniref:pyridoxamine 5'-phosphate oxidase family protein n=1 Tax=Devosia sp. TaxID=1871048 RepID=UPI002FCC6F29